MGNLIAHQIAHEDPSWLSAMIILGACWHKVKLSWTNITNGNSNIGCWQLEYAYLC